MKKIYNAPLVEVNELAAVLGICVNSPVGPDPLAGFEIVSTPGSEYTGSGD